MDNKTISFTIIQVDSGETDIHVILTWKAVDKLHVNAMKISEINSMTNSSYLVVLFCATAGKNGEDLGVDEEQIVLFVYLLYDVPNNKVSGKLNLSIYLFHMLQCV